MRLTIENQAREQVMLLLTSAMAPPKGRYKREVTLLLLLLVNASGAIIAVCASGACGRQDASRPGNGSRRSIQEDLHEPSRKRQVSFFFNNGA